MLKTLASTSSKALLLSLTLTAGNLFATSVTTDPLGVFFHYYPHASDTNIGLTLARPSAFEGSIASVDVANSTVTFAGSPDWDTNQFTGAEKHYLYIKSGEEEGMFVTVTGNTADTLTVFVDAGDRLDRIVAGETASVVPYWTPKTFFGDDAYDGLRIHFFRDFSATLNHQPDFKVQFDGTEWYDADTNELASNTPIFPGEGFIIRNTRSTSLSHSISGTVPMASSRNVLRSTALTSYKDQRVSFFTPVSVNVMSMTPLVSEGDTLYTFDMFTSILGKAATGGLIYCFGDWYDHRTFGIVNDSALIEAGRGYGYRGAQNISTTAAVLVKPQPYLD